MGTAGTGAMTWVASLLLAVTWSRIDSARPSRQALDSLGRFHERCVWAPASFKLSNTLGDHMVLQRGGTTVWGFGTPGAHVTTAFRERVLVATVGRDSIWRMNISSPANATPTNFEFSHAGISGVLALRDVLFGDVYMCGGQSNMQYTPSSMSGMNNKSAEVAAASGYGDTMRLFTVGMGTNIYETNCSQPYIELNTTTHTRPCANGASCRQNWTRASSKAVGGQAWDTFSAVCWLYGRDLHDALGGQVPIGLISSNWGGTGIRKWMPKPALDECSWTTPSPNNPEWWDNLWNSMIAPFTVGPMALSGAIWYQGEANVPDPSDYACAITNMIKWWRWMFKNDSMWFGFVQIAGYNYGETTASAELRQAQLAALRLHRVGMSTTIDTGAFDNIHPPDKQSPARRLANQALSQVYGVKTRFGSDFPIFAGSSVLLTQSSNGTIAEIHVTVAIRAGGRRVQLTTNAPLAATQSYSLGKGPSVPRNRCVTEAYNVSALVCGYPQIIGLNASGGIVSLNATATVGVDGSSVVLSATPPSTGFRATASSYGHASWPMTMFFDQESQLPVIPWHANFSTTDPAAPPV